MRNEGRLRRRKSKTCLAPRKRQVVRYASMYDCGLLCTAGNCAYGYRIQDTNEHITWAMPELSQEAIVGRLLLTLRRLGAYGISPRRLRRRNVVVERVHERDHDGDCRLDVVDEVWVEHLCVREAGVSVRLSTLPMRTSTAVEATGARSVGK